jgi:hypothetical protein
MSFNDVGKVQTFNEFAKTLQAKRPPAWATSITLHHTASPSLTQRPGGFTIKHIENMRDFYRSLGWRRGPHLFIDEDQIWHMTPLMERGVHAVSFNSRAIGIEVLGDYDDEDPFTGRGLQCWHLAAKTTALLLNWLGAEMNESTILFHRDDPKTSKTCPGSKIKKDWFFNLISKDQSSVDACEPQFLIKSNCDAVVDYVVKHKGYSQKEAAKLLSRKNNLFFFGNDWLEGAFYDKSAGATIAPVAELQQIKNK